MMKMTQEPCDMSGETLLDLKINWPTQLVIELETKEEIDIITEFHNAEGQFWTNVYQHRDNEGNIIKLTLRRGILQTFCERFKRIFKWN